jgi:arabinofuranosyltransferase
MARRLRANEFLSVLTSPTLGPQFERAVRGSTPIVLLLLAATAATCVAWAWGDMGRLVDDAYIYFRYAENLRRGLGLRWNAGMEPAEGYVDIVHILGLACLGWLGVPPAEATVGMSVAAVLGIIALLVVAAHPGRWYFPITVLPAFVFLFDSNTHEHAVRGLDTQLFAFLALALNASLTALIARGGRTKSMGVLAAVTGSLLFLTRPEGALLIGAGWSATWIVLAWRGQPLKSAGVAFAAVVGVGALYWAWRFAYFGHWLPNPFYFKAGGHGFHGRVETEAFLREYSPWWIALALLSAATFVLWVREPRGDRAANPISAAPLLAAMACPPWILYAAKIYHDVGFSHRFAYPLMPIVLLGLSAGGSSLLQRLPSRRAQPLLGWIATGLLIALSVGALRSAASLRAQYPPHPDRATESFLRLGRALRDTGLTDRLTLVCSHAGATPFVAGCRHIDPVGLTDNSACMRRPAEERERYLKSLEYDVRTSQWFPASPGATEFDEDPGLASPYIRGFRLSLPEGFDESRLTETQRQTLDQRKQQAFDEMRDLRDRDTLVGEMESSRGAGRLFVYVKKSSPWHDTLLAKLRPRMDQVAELIDKHRWPE